MRVETNTDLGELKEESTPLISDEQSKSSDLPPEKKFNPTSSYQWQVDDKFIVTGKELEILNFTIKILQSRSEYKEFLLIQQAGKFLDKVFERNIDLLEEVEPKK